MGVNSKACLLEMLRPHEPSGDVESRAVAKANQVRSWRNPTMVLRKKGQGENYPDPSELKLEI
jgi:hypothetical protein